MFKATKRRTDMADPGGTVKSYKNRSRQIDNIGVKRPSKGIDKKITICFNYIRLIEYNYKNPLIVYYYEEMRRLLKCPQRKIPPTPPLLSM